MCCSRGKWIGSMIVSLCVPLTLVNPTSVSEKAKAFKSTTFVNPTKIAPTKSVAGMSTSAKAFDPAVVSTTPKPDDDQTFLPPEFLFYGIAHYKQYFFDKTKFIETLLNEPQPLYVTAPRNFGKTSIISMLDSFFRLRIDHNGTALSKVLLRSTQDYKVFSDIYNNEQMYIFKKASLFDAHFGQYPILRLDFKQLNVDSIHQFYASFLDLMRQRFSANAKFLTVSKTNESMDMTILANHEGGTMKDEHAAVIASGRLMTKVFFQQFGKQSIVLIDDVDSPIRRMLSGGRLECDDVSEIDGKISEFLRALLKDNMYVRTAFLTGRTRYASIHTDTTGGADNVKLFHYSERSDLAETFGLMDREVKALVERRPHPKLSKERLYEELVDWYDGYFGASGMIGQSRIFNTRGVIQTVHSGEASFWLNDEPPPFEVGFWIDFVGSRVYQTILGNPVNITIPERIETQHILDLFRTMKFLNGQYNYMRHTHIELPIYRDSFMTYLYELGLMTFPRGTVTHRSNGVVIPNLETRAIFFELLLNAFRVEFQFSNKSEHAFEQSILMLNNTRSSHSEFVDCIKDLFKTCDPPIEPQNLEAVLYTLLALSEKLQLRQFVHNDAERTAELPSFIIANGVQGIFLKARYGLKRSPSDGLNQMFKAMNDPHYIRACIEHNILKFILVSLHYTEKTFSCGFIYGMFAPGNNTAVVPMANQFSQ